MASGLPVRAKTSTAVSANLITCASPCPTARMKVSLAVSSQVNARRPAVQAAQPARRAQPERRQHAVTAPRYLGLWLVIARSCTGHHWQNLASFGRAAIEFTGPLTATASN